jgi:hypothetical protein
MNRIHFVNYPFAMRMPGLRLLLCVCLTACSAAHAEHGREFAGQYALSGVVESNGTVSAMLTVRIVNYSGHDIRGARLQLAGSGMVIADNIGFANHTHRVIRTPVSVPAREFALWRHGPELEVEWRETDGSLARRPVELLRSMIGELK